MKSLTIFAFLLVVLPLQAFGIREPLVGGWRPIKDINHHEVQEAAKFAVTEYNEESKRSLKFLKVVYGEEQVVSGTKFKLHLTAEDGGAKKNYEAIVWVKPWLNFKKLLSFKRTKG